MLKSIQLTFPCALLTLLTMPALSHAGNGLPNGPMNGSVNLQIIAFENCPSGDFTDSNRHMIAVKADFSPDVHTGTPRDDFLRTNTISLAQGETVQVTDGNGCSRGGAEMTLPLTIDNLDCSDTPDDPSCPEPDFTEYRVYVRLVGRPGSTLDVTACGSEVDDTVFDENDTLEVLCSTESTVDLSRTSGRNGRPKFKDYSAELLTICLAVDTDRGTCVERLPLFDSLLDDYMWKLDTGGRPHAQLKLVPVVSP